MYDFSSTCSSADHSPGHGLYKQSSLVYHTSPYKNKIRFFYPLEYYIGQQLLLFEKRPNVNNQMQWCVSGLGSITIDDYDYDYDYMSFLFIDYDYDYVYSSL